MDLREDNIYVPFAVSVLIHSLFLFTVISSAARLPRTTASAPLEVEVLRPEANPANPAPKAAAPPGGAEIAPPRIENQIVAPPDSPEAESENPRYLSDKNSRAEEEMVKRGQPAPPAEPPKTAGKKEQGPSEETKGAQGKSGENRLTERPQARVDAARRSARELPGLPDLFARPSDVISDPRLAGRDDGTGDAGQGLRNRDLAKLSRPELWAEPGERGTLDYLPEIRQGKFTLLNTKADLFAPFVRRVGLRVFQTFSMDFKRRIFGGGVPQGKEKVEIEAVMSRDGRRIEVALKRRDGNLSTDRVLLATINDAIFFDENPPPGAIAADGRIHFVFALDAAVWYQPTENGVQPGAQWIFGAGLL